MDQFHHVSTAFLELGKKLVLIFVHLSIMNFNVPWYMWFLSCCLFPIFCPLLFITLGEVGVYCLVLRQVTNFIWKTAYESTFVRFNLSLFCVECQNLDTETVVACCGCGGHQSHASFNVITYYIDYCIQIDG